MIGEVYRNYRMYNHRGRRLAIFAKKSDKYTDEKPEVNICIYECSVKDNFNKKVAYDHYLNNKQYFKSICYDVNVPFDLPSLNSYVSKHFYRKMLVPVERIVEQKKLPVYFKQGKKKNKLSSDYFLVNTKGKTNSNISLRFI